MFYEELCKNHLEKKYDKDVFRFFHLSGAHPPYTMNENCQKAAEGDSNEYRQALGSLKIAVTYINELKEAGVYDDSVIMVIADHGNQSVLDGANPIFLIKNANERKNFSISQEPVSLFDFGPMVVDALKNGAVDIYNNYAYKDKARYFYASFLNKEKDTLYEYKIDGNVRNFDSFYETGRTCYYGIKKNSFDYKLGTKLYLTEEATGNPYCIEGFDRNEIYGTWTRETKAQMKFKFAKPKNDLLLVMNYSVYESPQKIILYANGEKVLDTVSSHGPTVIELSKNCLNKSEILDLTFELPNAIYSGGRYLGLFMKDITISEIGKNAKKYTLGTTLDFTETATANPYCTYGFDTNEFYGTWINSTAAQMEFKTGKVKSDLLLTMNYSTYDSPQKIMLYANGEKILDVVSESGQTQAVIPKRCLADTDVLSIKFDIPTAHPIEKEGNRCLALFMKDITISKVEGGEK